MAIQLMIVDDAPFIREVVKQIAVSEGINVVGEAENGLEAVELAFQLKPEVILMDMVMPKKNGVQATKEILEKLPQTKIIACSTVDDNDMMMKAIEAGCCHYLPKPFEKSEILNTIQQVFKGEIK